ncbi:MAG: hypothetical protein EA378_04520 [Phycisphaerales bacterium]|nr:MAG: hypothetical protein EA378_04520 [Phycisphaerales bacterium]
MLVHLNGHILSAHEARVSPFDRGFLFGDGVYEGLRAFEGQVRAGAMHVERFREGLAASGIDFDAERLIPLTEDLLIANGTPDAFVYWQVTRGTPGDGQPRRSRLPAGAMAATVFGFATPMPALSAYTTPPTCRVARVPDLRWHRGTIKSISLHGNILAAMEASEHGATETVMIRDGLVSEACASNVVLAVPDGLGGTRLVTPSLESVSILAGVTRRLILDLDPTIETRAVLAEELDEASEIILVGTNSMVTSAIELDGRPVGDGTPGPEARRLLHRLVSATRAEMRGEVSRSAVATV